MTPTPACAYVVRPGANHRIGHGIHDHGDRNGQPNQRGFDPNDLLIVEKQQYAPRHVLARTGGFSDAVEEHRGHAQPPRFGHREIFAGGTKRMRAVQFAIGASAIVSSLQRAWVPLESE